MTALNYCAPTTAPYYLAADAVVTRAPSDPAPILRSALYEPAEEPFSVGQKPSIIPLHSRKDRVKARFRLLRRLPANHDSEGAAAPNTKTVDAAIAFIDRMRTHPELFATLDDDGSAVIEFENAGCFGDVTFCDDGTVECYARPATGTSSLIEGDLNSPQVKSFLENNLGISV